MTGNILSYLKEYGRYSLREKSFNDVDALILCQFAYLKFDGLVPGPDQDMITITDLLEHPDFDNLFLNPLFERQNRELLSLMIGSERFKTMRLGEYVNRIELKLEIQFSALTCLLDNDILYIAFRGTDENLVAWKEDFNMISRLPVPAQEEALIYLNRVGECFNGRILIGGHSKGGNLAVYAAMCCREKIQERLVKIYNMDGPGFPQATLIKYDYERIADRVLKLLPHSSLIGMIFEQKSSWHVVESRGLGIFQHDAYTWIVRGDHFVEVPGICRQCKKMNHIMNQWLQTIGEDRAQSFFDALFDGFGVREKQIAGGSWATAWTLPGFIMNTIQRFDRSVLGQMQESMKALFEVAGEDALHSLRNNIGKNGSNDIGR